MTNMARRNSGIVIAIAVMGCATSWLVRTPTGAQPGLFQASLGINFAVAVLFAGAAVIFLQNLKGFSVKLKRAYLLFSLGMTLLGLAQFQLPFSILLNINNEYWYRNSLNPLLYLSALIIIYIGARSFARLFAIRRLVMRWWFFVLCLVGMATITSILPHVAVPSTEIEFDATNGFIAFMLVVNTFSCTYFFLVKRVASAVYTNALAWLIIGFVIMILDGAQFVVIHVLAGETGQLPELEPLLVGAMFVVAGLCFVRAAYSFSRIQAMQDFSSMFVVRNFFGRPKHAIRKTTVSSIDIVVYTASLASNSQAIDPMLDKVRVITARGTKELSASDQSVLRAVYLGLERYLLEEENVRVFSPETLRQTIAQSLGLTSDQHTFWGQLPPI